MDQPYLYNVTIMTSVCLPPRYTPDRKHAGLPVGKSRDGEIIQEEEETGSVYVACVWCLRNTKGRDHARGAESTTAEWSRDVAHVTL